MNEMTVSSSGDQGLRPSNPVGPGQPTVFATADPPPPKTKTKQAEQNVNVDAWWWKDVLVRKSLLEECAGERLSPANPYAVTRLLTYGNDRFERLLLALSTHTLSKASGPRSIGAADPAVRSISLLEHLRGY